MVDILLRGGLVVDGTGSEPRQADVAVSSGRVVAVGRLEGAAAERVFDVRGLAVAPGFIDMHSHSDLSLPSHPCASSSLLQGITTEVAGSCGWSLAPVRRETAATVLKRLTQALLGSVPPELGVGKEDGEDGPAWHSFGEYLDHLERTGIGVNLYPVVGQSLIRAHVVGSDRRPATVGELKAMKALLEVCLEEGARGLSTGRSYEPGSNAPTREIIALAAVAASRGAIYTSHVKDESDGVVEAVEEAVRVGRETGVSVEISHHKAVGEENAGKVDQTLALMEEARRSGVDVTCDAYPYAFAQVFSLLNEFPGVERVRSLEETARLLATDEFRQAAVGELIKAAAPEGRLKGFFGRPHHYRVVSAGGDGDVEGLTLAEALGLGDEEAAAAPDPDRVRRLVDRAAELLLSHDLTIDLAATMCEDAVAAVLGHPETMVGTDAFALDHRLDERTPVHPRHYGTFPRVLGHYRRERRLGDLAGLVHKLTAKPARKLGLGDRGLLARGAWADIVVFDPETIGDRATVREPYLAPTGIKLVLVNGRVAVEDGEVTSERAGRLLRR